MLIAGIGPDECSAAIRRSDLPANKGSHQSPCNADIYSREGRTRIPHKMRKRPLPTSLVVPEDWPHPLAELVTIAARPEPSSSSPAAPPTCPKQR